MAGRNLAKGLRVRGTISTTIVISFVRVVFLSYLQQQHAVCVCVCVIFLLIFWWLNSFNLWKMLGAEAGAS